MRIQQSVKSIEVYDDFAFIVFQDESVVLTFRPEELGGLAQYNNKISTDETLSGYLSFRTSSIVYYDIVPDSSQQYNYILNLLTEDRKPDKQTGKVTQYLSQQWIVIEDNNAWFKELKKPEPTEEDQL